MFLIPRLGSYLLIFCICMHLWLVAAIEVVGDFLPEFLTDMSHLDFNRDHLLERLGLMFMLVLGETMLGMLVQRYKLDLPETTYTTLLSSFFLVVTLGIHCPRLCVIRVYGIQCWTNCNMLVLRYG